MSEMYQRSTDEVLAELGSDGIEKLVKQHMGIE